MSTLHGASGDQKGWSRQFDDPIPTSDGGELRSLRDAGVYILALPPAEAEREHWQVAMEVLIFAAEKGGIVMMAHIAMLRALNHGDPEPALAPSAAPREFGDPVATWPRAAAEPVHFSVELGAERGDYDGLSIQVETIAGPVSVWVGRSNANAAAAYSLLRRFIHDAIWAVSFLVLATLAIGILAIRGGLKSIRDVSEMAAKIAPNTMSVRLPDKGLPSEVAPLVKAVNRALDRVEQGFSVQRQFTANAAHELRTPLAIITAALDEMEDDERVAELRADVARMNRLVEQLLRVARLDAVVLDVTETVDLNELAKGVVASMAPWALTRGRTIGFTRSDTPVRAKGNIHAVSDALRNLIENAVVHSPTETEVLVRVQPDGIVSVADRGPGIPPADRERIFDRFWRGRGAQFEGAGLGLAIVKEIMKAHGGTASVADNPMGGTIFTMCFPMTRRGNGVT